VTVFSEPHEFLLRGIRGASFTPPAIETIKFKPQCLKNFDGRSVQTRANASAQYATIYQSKIAGSFIMPEFFGWVRQIEDRSITEQGCEVYPQGLTKTVVFEKVSDDPVTVMQYAFAHNLF